MRPLLGEFAAAIDQVVEQPAIVRTQARKQHLVMRGDEDVDTIDLQQTETVDRAPDAADAYAITRPWPIESLRGESNAPGFGQ